MAGKFKKPERFPLTGPLDVPDYNTFAKQSKADFFKFFGSKWIENAQFDDFKIKKQIGSGSFGIVFLVTYKKDNTLLAMKTIDKSKIVKDKQVVNTKREMDILKCLIYPFTVHLEHFFKDNSNLYFMLPFISGGELYNHFKMIGKFNERQARFFTAQVVLAIEYLHTLEIAYRDLKPENILIDHTGYLKLTDFGFSKIVKARTYTICGTPEYMAPEIILNTGYGRAVDWWAAGVLVYELVAGKTPFFSKNSMYMYERSTTGVYEMPAHFSADLQDFISNFLQVDLSRRYGNLLSGAEDIKNHNWLCNIDWQSVFNRKVTAPYIPTAITTDGDETDIQTVFKISPKNDFKREFAIF